MDATDDSMLYPIKVLPHINTVNNEDLTKFDMMQLIIHYINENGLIRLDEYNKFVNYGLAEIMENNFKTHLIICVFIKFVNFMSFGIIITQ